MKISISVSGEKAVVTHLDGIAEGIADLRKGTVWLRVAQAFRRIEKDHFAGEGTGASGKWAPLTPRYAKAKQAKYGKLPINQRTKALYKSLTQAGGDAVVEEGPQQLTLGTRVPYAGYVHGRRPIIDFTPEQEKQLVEPIERYLRQLADNERLRSLR